MINHWTTAVAVHSANHPLTEHIRADVREVDPDDVLPGRRIAYLHASPDCTDHSKAKGGKPRRKEIRALADVVIVWAAKRRPDVITLENVEEFRQWGPLLDCGQPDPKRRGQEFDRWKGELEALGYMVEARELRACDYGAPTTRKRLFVIARCDGKPIIWPEKTHGKNVRGNVAGDFQSQSRHSVGLAGGVLRSEDGERPNDHAVSAGSAEPSNHHQPSAGGRHDKSTRSAVSNDPLKPYLTAADCIDWSLPMLSIFATPDEAKAFARQHGVGVPRRPLKPKTLARIAGGLDKFVLKAAKPFIVSIQNYGWGTSPTRDVDAPMPTVTAGPKGGAYAVADVALAPYSVPRYGERPPMFVHRCGLVNVESKSAARCRKCGKKPFPKPGQPPRCQSIDEPAATITGTGNGTNLVAATLAPYIAHVDHTGTTGRGRYFDSLEEPAKTITGANGKALIAAHLSTLNHGGPEHRATSPDAPLPTVCGANDARALVAALVTKGRGDSKGRAADEPMFTITSGAGAVRDAGAAHALSVTCAYLSHFYTSNSRGGEGDPLKPAKTITSGGQHAAVTVAMATPYLVGTGGATYAAKPKSADEPANTVMVNDRRAIVAAFLAAYYGEGSGKVGHTPGEPMPTVVGRERFALVTVEIDGTTYVVTDIAMRMLTPRELANAQGFPGDYVLDRTADGKPVSKADQVKLIGNAVPPAFARAIVKANVVDQGVLGEPPALKRRTRRQAVPA